MRGGGFGSRFAYMEDTMRKCDICKKDVENGAIARVYGEDVVICSHCLIYSDNIKVKLARHLAQKGKRSRVDGEIAGKCEYALFGNFRR